ncbi:hypothetical protein CFAM422_008719 [Trichoderma lentiforme]|uniref:Zn(2)-C6 fungal-type domain-containing protein n=1 Tax=Trichoderma lentiforme TaxID=1567552 RepID=A0A9P4X8Y9_9HYPO|nr:hypothetical protein CFAM422_008719 [Trichoderma lentiforme]
MNLGREAGGKSRASHACVSCKENKRKCSKELPSCQLCIRAERKCRYAKRTPTVVEIRRLRRRLHSLEGATHEEQAEPELFAESADATGSVLPSVLVGSLGDAETDVFCYPQIRYSYVNTSVTNSIANLVGGFSSFSEDDSFFDTIHAWLPIISRKRYTQQLSALAMRPDAEMSLLALCVRLVTDVPRNAGSESMRTSLYVNAKCLASYIEAGGRLSIRTVQSLLLIGLYELGHGFEKSAYASISHTAAVARMLRVDKLCEENYNPAEFRGWDVEEARRVWWGIIIMDRLTVCSEIDIYRYANLQSCNANFAIHIPSSTYRLPKEKTSQDLSDNSKPALLSIESTVWVEPFAREAQVAYLLGRVLSHTCDPTSDPNFNFNEAVMLQAVLTTFKSLLPEEIDRCARYCGAIGICNRASALLLLCNSSPKADANDSTVAAVIDIASNYQTLLETGEIKNDELSPFVLYSLYQSATVLANWMQRSRDLSYIQSYRCILNMLEGFNARWKLAEHYIQLLQQPLQHDD